MQRTGPAGDVRHARAEPAANECEVRIGVGRLNGLLLRAQLVTQFQLVVPIPGAFRKHRAEKLEIRPDSVGPGRKS